MEQQLKFSVEEGMIRLNDKSYERLEFVDVCARTNERLLAWRKGALEKGMSPERVQASMAVDIKPVSEDVHTMDVLDFLSMLPRHSVNTINGDYINIISRKRKKHLDAMSAIAPCISPVVSADGEVFLTMPLHMHDEVVDAMHSIHMKIEAIAFGYVGFLGGRNNLFPAEGLPPVEGISACIRQALEHVKEREESNNPIDIICAQPIGDYAYLGTNPIRYRATRVAS